MRERLNQTLVRSPDDKDGCFKMSIGIWTHGGSFQGYTLAIFSSTILHFCLESHPEIPNDSKRVNPDIAYLVRNNSYRHVQIHRT